MDEEAFEKLMADTVPDNLHDGIREYVLRGRGVGGFLTKCFENNFTQVVIRADDQMEIEALQGIARLLFNECPQDCWGSVAKVEAWKKQGGWEGGQ